MRSRAEKSTNIQQVKGEKKQGMQIFFIKIANCYKN